VRRPSRAALLEQPLEDGGRALQRSALRGIELAQAPLEVRVLAVADARQQLAGLRRDGDERRAGVGRIGRARDQASLLQAGEDAGRGRPLDPLARGVSGPWRSTVASADACDGLSSPPASWRSRRAVRTMARRRRTARSAWEVVRIAN
jgi:hypothetical protein